MIDSSNGVYFSFSTSEPSWPLDGPEIRLSLAAALADAGAEIDTEIDPHEVDWVFKGVYKENRFSVVLVIMKYNPCNWFIMMEGDKLSNGTDAEVRNWAQPILETTIRNRDGTANFRWHDTHDTLRELC